MHNTNASTRSTAKSTPAWVLMDDTEIYATPASFSAIARVSQHTPVSLTGYWQIVNKTNWVQVMWHTGAQSHTGWIQANSLTKQSFSGISSASIGMLSARLQGYLASLGSSVGVAVYIPSTNQYYLYNASQEFPTASSIKIPIMLTPHLSGQVIAKPGLGTDAVNLYAPLKPVVGQHGTLEGSLHVPVQGVWEIAVQLNGPQGHGSVSITITAAAPGAIPVWLGWLIGTIPAMGCSGISVVIAELSSLSKAFNDFLDLLCSLEDKLHILQGTSDDTVPRSAV